MNIHSAEFIISASKLSECPQTDIPEFAFIGRSNVGKSSLINMLAERKQLAKTSVTPGKTQLLNYFCINGTRHLVDLPGYGYAKISKTQREERHRRMADYLLHRKQLIKTFLLIDWSIPPQKIDIIYIKEIHDHSIPFDIILTKTDKCTQKDFHKNFSSLQKEIQETIGILPKIFKTSSTKKRGKKEIKEYITSHLENPFFDWKQ